ncbi:hypothetical protein [Burkholderia aenigmatica]|uniref:hypothetical protein n=1 Tax=Burkholderia aenigmatica TaxID=2015348 RepID=UPI001583AA3E|nr:hypothetical protein [Burkholderia aenigmatica]
MIKSVIKPRRPKADGWKFMGPASPETTLGFEGECWFHRESRLFVISAVEVAAPEGGISKGPEYHVSISLQTSDGTARCTSADALFVLAAFELLEAEEDNHVPNGRVRNFWRPIADNLVGLECACKADEPAIVEDKGDYVWRGVTR